VPSEIGAEEAEEVGVEHLLRDIKDTTAGTLSQRITNQLMGLRGLHSQLDEIYAYLEQVCDDKLPINHQIIYLLEDIFNLVPDVTLQSFVQAVFIKTNDQQLVLYVAALVRSILALHNLINNKVQNRDAERNEGKEATKKGDAAKTDGKDKKKDDGKDKKKDESLEKDKTSKSKEGSKNDSTKTEKDLKDSASKPPKKK